jgi:hypothetical protein
MVDTRHHSHNVTLLSVLYFWMLKHNAWLPRQKTDFGWTLDVFLVSSLMNLPSLAVQMASMLQCHRNHMTKNAQILIKYLHAE